MKNQAKNAQKFQIYYFFSAKKGGRHDEKHNAKNVADGTIRLPNQGDWAADSHVTFRGLKDRCKIMGGYAA